MNMKTFVEFVNETEIHIISLCLMMIAFILERFLLVPWEPEQGIADLLAFQFEQNFSDDKSKMIYFVM